MVNEPTIEIINLSPKLGETPHVKGLLEAVTKNADSIIAKAIAAKLGGPGNEVIFYQWQMSDNIKGPFVDIQGMHSRTLILLDSYIGKYLRAMVILPFDCVPRYSAPTTAPVEATAGNPLTDWFHSSHFGASHHFLSNIINSPNTKANEREGWDMKKVTWNDFVSQHDAEKYARQMSEIGVSYVLLTVGQNAAFYCAPNDVYDAYLRDVGLLGKDEVNPKTVSRENDLPMKIGLALRKYGIRLMLYLPSNPPHSASWNEFAPKPDYLVTKKVFDYTPGQDGIPNQRSRKVYAQMVEWWSLRYGDLVHGWWFDGCYAGGILESQMDMSLYYNLSSLANAAKAGNPYSIVTFNQGTYIEWAFKKSNPYQDYTAGESQALNTFLTKERWSKDSKDCQNHIFGPIGRRDNYQGGWGCKGTSRTVEFLIKTLQGAHDNNHAITFDCKMNVFGELDPDQLAQLKQLKSTASCELQVDIGDGDELTRKKVMPYATRTGHLTWAVKIALVLFFAFLFILTAVFTMLKM